MEIRGYQVVNKFFKQLFCLHYWVEYGDYWVFGRLGLTEWQCRKCQKKITKPVEWFPINPVDEGDGL
jgi:hypothetical protein